MLSLSRHIARRLALSTNRWNRHNHSLNSVTEQDIAVFSQILPPSSILSTLPPVSLPATELAPYNNDWMGKYHGHASTVLKPRNTQEVSDIVKHCWERRIGIVPQGGNTGLVGGSVPVNDELVLNLGNMSKVRSFDPVSGSFP
jgi:FAD/FMN-containing dehydrogenase